MTLSKLARHFPIFNILCATLALAGCGASSGRMVTPEQASQFQAGKATYREVVSALGAPTTRRNNPDGSFSVAYAHSDVAARPESFIPIVGAFVGGADATSHSVEMAFGRDGVLSGTTSQDSSIASSAFGGR